MDYSRARARAHARTHALTHARTHTHTLKKIGVKESSQVIAKTLESNFKKLLLSNGLQKKKRYKQMEKFTQRERERERETPLPFSKRQICRQFIKKIHLHVSHAVRVWLRMELNQG